MKTFYILLCALCVGFAARAADAPATLTLQCDGSVRLPDTRWAFVPRLAVDGAETFAVGETAATPDGVRFEFRAPGKGVLATGFCQLSTNINCSQIGNANPVIPSENSAASAAPRGNEIVATWRFTLAKDAKKAEWGAAARLPHDEFSPDEVVVDGNGATVRGLRIAAVAPERLLPVLSDVSGRSPFHPLWRLSFDGGKAEPARRGDVFELRLAFSIPEPGREATLRPRSGHSSGEAALAGGSEAAAGLALAFAGPAVVPDGGGWVPMEHRKTILPGSALDFSRVVPHDAPAGKHGFLRAVGDHVEFEGLPGVPQRFCGVNLCNTANFPETPEEAATLAERIARLGYNAVRIHHHDGYLARYENGTLVPIPENVDRLDRLIAECTKRGLYLTTDLHVSRGATWRDFGIDRDGRAMVKAVQFSTERGFRDWCDFARIFLGHVNPYTGRSLAEDPALVFLCTQNECLLDEDFKGMCAVPELGIAEKWAAFVAESREKNPGAWPGIRPDRPADRTLPWDVAAGKDAALFGFWNWLHARFFRRAEAFLRDELGVKALLTGDNFCLISGSVLEMQDSLYGYCDQHIYLNEVLRWIDGNWRTPLAVESRNPILRSRGMKEEDLGYFRLWGKPFCVTEWNYKGLGADRSMAGIAFGSMAARQGWAGLWRFAYSHNRNVFGDGRGAPEHFDLARDPLALASDRATLALYLRGDMAEAADALAIDYTDEVLDPAQGRGWRVEPGWRQSDAAWRFRVGSAIRGRGVPDGARVVARDECAKTDPAGFAAPFGGVAIDRKRGTFSVATPRTCGLFARGGKGVAGVLSVVIGDESHAESTESTATVFATSLDGAPLAESRGILVTHLTDCRARGFATTDELGSIILRWNGAGDPDGTLPLYLKEGTAEIELEMFTNLKCSQISNATNDNCNLAFVDNGEQLGFVNNPAEWRVFALGTDGRRECEVPCAFDPATGRLRFTASVRQPFGGCMLYELVRNGN